RGPTPRSPVPIRTAGRPRAGEDCGRRRPRCRARRPSRSCRRREEPRRCRPRAAAWYPRVVAAYPPEAVEAVEGPAPARRTGRRAAPRAAHRRGPAALRHAPRTVGRPGALVSGALARRPRGSRRPAPHPLDEQTHRGPVAALPLIRQLAVAVRGARDVEMRPARLADEPLQERRGRDRPARAPAHVLQIRRLAVELAAILLPDRERPAALARALARLAEL